MTLEAIENVFEGSHETAANDENEMPLSPATGAYLVAVDSKKFRTEVVEALLRSRYGVKESLSRVVGDFDPDDYTIGEVDQAAAAAMGAAVNTIGEPEANIGLWAAISVVKSEWGDHHTDVVSGEGHHGVGLKHPKDDNDLEFSTTRKGSYGDTYPELPAFDDVLGWAALEENEARYFTKEHDIPVSDIALIGDAPRFIAPDGERFPVVVEGKEDLSDALERIMELPHLEGPDGYDGEPETGTMTAEDSETPDVSDDVPVPGTKSVKEIRKMVSDLKDPEVIEEMIRLEKSNKNRSTALDRLESRLNRLNEESDADEGSESVEDAVEAAVEEADDGDETVDEEAGSGVIEGMDVPEPGTVPKWKFELALNQAGMPGDRAAEVADDHY